MDDRGNIHFFNEGDIIPKGLTPLTDREAKTLQNYPPRQRKAELKKLRLAARAKAKAANIQRQIKERV